MKIGLLIIMTFLMSSCNTIEVLDGLCYNDREGTFLCPQELEIPPQEPINLENQCEFEKSLEDRIEECIMVA